MPDDNKNQSGEGKETWGDWYNGKYDVWYPWMEDKYLQWFGKGDNKASYATKDALSKTKVTGISQVDQVQDTVNNAVGDQLGDRGLAAPLGNMASKEGINRAERGGKDDSGNYLSGAAGSVANAGSSAGSSLASGAKGAGSYVGGFFSGGKDEGKSEGKSDKK